MNSIEVLVATMNQIDFKKYYDMNIKTNAVFANQSIEYSYEENIIENRHVKMITTNSKGVGKNRNQALLHSTADICLLSDDDMLYVDNYSEIVEQAFNELPEADIIIFNIDTIGKEVKRRMNRSIRKVNILNFQNYGAARIAFRRKAILRKNIWFSLLFGGGTIYSSGEDTLFLREALRKGLKVYTYPKTIGTVNQEESSWFTGYNEKFYFDKGVLLSAIFPLLKYPIGLIYFPWRFKNQAELSINKIRYCILSGMKAYSKGLNYDNWKNSLSN
jgi:glycosyltransferase involved in cell wall biosynthesis